MKQYILKALFLVSIIVFLLGIASYILVETPDYYQCFVGDGRIYVKVIYPNKMREREAIDSLKKAISESVLGGPTEPPLDIFCQTYVKKN